MPTVRDGKLQVYKTPLELKIDTNKIHTCLPRKQTFRTHAVRGATTIEQEQFK